MKKVNTLAVLLIAAVLAACAKTGETTLSQLAQDAQIADGAQITDGTDSNADHNESVGSGSDRASGSADGTQEASIFVYVCGCVENPGVYELPEGSRVCDALDSAGGFADGADESRINLAGILADGEMVFFPEVGEEIPEGASDHISAGNAETAGARVNINTAGEDALCTLPGIGSSKAQAIMKYREEHGCFKDIRDIMNVNGIGEILFKQIEDLICV